MQLTLPLSGDGDVYSFVSLRVEVRLGQERRAKAGTGCPAVSLGTTVTLDGEPLTPSEVRAVLHRSDRPILLRGRWCKVNGQRLQRTLEHWKQFEAGVPLPQALRLLAGLDTGNAQVQAGPALRELLAQLHPSSIIHPPSALPLRPYQQAGVRWMRMITDLGLGACLADDMGLGKTVQVIALLAEKLKTPDPSLVVAPASLIDNWRREFKRFAPQVRVSTQLVHSPDVVLATYASLTRNSELRTRNWDLVVLDEAQAIKTPNARQSRTAKLLRSRARVACTGTPIENRLRDLWSIFDFLCPGLLGGSKEFDLMTPEQAQACTSRFILRRLKTDQGIVDELPEKTEEIVWCELSEAQRDAYERSVAGFRGAGRGIERRGAILALITELKQICNGDGKLARLGELCAPIAQRAEKVLVFTQYRQATEPLAHYLAGVFGRSGLVLHGGVPVQRRQAVVDAFQRPTGPPFFVLSLKVGGCGLNLTAACNVIHFDRWWNPAVENQASDRAYRIGQRCAVMVHKLLCRGTVEERIEELITAKSNLAAEVLTAPVTPITEMSDEELLRFIELRPPLAAAA